jgi:hypothetical protein
MPQSYKQDLLDLKKSIEEALEKTNQEIIDYLPTANDEAFMFLIKRAIIYRDTLQKIKEELLNL